MTNKTQVIEALGERLGDRKVAADAVDGIVDIIVRAVNDGERVTITGFGAFEKRTRAARTARNPRTGEAVTVSATEVPAFRAGTMFRQVVSGDRKLAAPAGAKPAASKPTATKVSDPAPKKTKKATKAEKPAKSEKDSAKGKKTKKAKKKKK